MIQYYILGGIFVFGFYLIWRNRAIAVMSRLKPENYVSIFMFNLDRSVSFWIQKKPTGMKFYYKEGEYNLYHRPVVEPVVEVSKYEKK